VQERRGPPTLFDLMSRQVSGVANLPGVGGLCSEASDQLVDSA
jgi:hypothetical protein